MLLDHPHFPITVLLVLPKERLQRSPWAVPAFHDAGLPDSAPCPGEPQVKFVILISNQLLVEHSDPFENIATVKTSENRVRPPLISGIMPAGPADGKGTVVRGGNRALHGIVPLTKHPSADIICLGLSSRFPATKQIVRSVTGVAAHNRDPLAACGPNPCIHATG